MSSPAKFGIIAMVGLVAFSGAAHATNFYTSSTKFVAAAGTLPTITFDNLIGTPSFPQNYAYGTGYFSAAPIKVNGTTFMGFTQGLGTSSIEEYILGPDVGGGDYSLNGSAALVLGRGAATITFASPITAVGVEVGLNGGLSGTLGISALYTDGTTGTGGFILVAGKTTFAGLIDTKTIKSISITNLSANLPGSSLKPYIVLDNVALGGPGVPEPGSVSLLIAGCVALLATRRARQTA